eukprot:COSAG02_NODE_751_length_17653_cov_172.765011_6_plen_82_part_00
MRVRNPARRARAGAARARRVSRKRHALSDASRGYYVFPYLVSGAAYCFMFVITAWFLYLDGYVQLYRYCVHIVFDIVIVIC